VKPAYKICNPQSMISRPAYPHTACLQSQAAACIYRPRLVFHFVEPEEAEPSASAFSSMLARGGVASPGLEGIREAPQQACSSREGDRAAPDRCLSGCHEGKRYGAPRFFRPQLKFVGSTARTCCCRNSYQSWYPCIWIHFLQLIEIQWKFWTLVAAYCWCRWSVDG
jgi:hypothetical protein